LISAIKAPFYYFFGIYPSSYDYLIIIYHPNSSIERVEAKKEASLSKAWKLSQEGWKDHHQGN